MDLNEIRMQIDQLDQSILHLFEQRMELCQQVAAYKKHITWKFSKKAVKQSSWSELEKRHSRNLCMLHRLYSPRCWI